MNTKYRGNGGGKRGPEGYSDEDFDLDAVYPGQQGYSDEEFDLTARHPNDTERLEVDEPDEEFVEAGPLEVWMIEHNISRRAMIRFGVATGVLAVLGIGIGPEAMQAMKVKGVWKDVEDFQKWIKEEVIEKKSQARSAPTKYAELLESKLEDLDDLIEDLQELFEDGFRIRNGLAYLADEYIKKGIAFTRNDSLDEVSQMISDKHGGGLLSSGAVAVKEWLGEVNVDNYGSLISAVNKVRARLVELRKKVVQLGDIDLWTATNNNFVNMSYGHEYGEHGMKRVIERKEKRRGKLLRLWKLHILGKQLSKGDEGSKVNQLQTLLAEFGYLNEDQIDSDYGGVTEGAVKRLQSVHEKSLSLYDKYENGEKIPAEFDPLVKKHQENLIYLGYLPEEEDDGKYGNKTHNAIRKLREEVDEIKQERKGNGCSAE